ncbi:hypothetical protein [Jiangella gansuensis]|uniref:hypothetical protein n=1 Tax=Jiangella gansuensis TaxID=281473 RepID=UPI00047B5DCA|nr:hypothetical protein [Jiangella gansuensis]
MSVNTVQSDNLVTKTEGRVAAVSALMFAVCLFWTVASVNVPRDASDTELLAWWQEADNLVSILVSSVFAVVAAVLFAVVVNRVLRLPAAGRAPAWLGFARSMGAAFVATLLVTGATRGVIGHLVERLDEPLPSLDVLRYSTALNYLLLDLPVMTALALTIAAIGVVTLRTSVLPRWSAYVGLAAALVILGAVAAGIGAYATPAALLWAVCLSAVLWRRS